MHDLKIIDAYLSIPAGIEFKVPKFTVIIGQNGSGKSHLLQALSGLHSRSKNTGNPRAVQIRLGALTKFGNRPYDVARIFEDLKRQSSWIKIALKTFALDDIGSMEERLKETEFERGQYLDERGAIEFLIKAHELGFDLSKPTPYIAGLLTPISKLSETSLLNLKDVDLKSLFFEYKTRQSHNDFVAYQFQSGKNPFKPLSEIEFKEFFGPSPWESLNDTLEQLGLPYEFQEPPDPLDFDDYKIELLHKSKGIGVEPSSLSSGELTLLSISTLMNILPATGNKDLILLFDEPDASLHPSNCKTLVKLIRESLVGKHGYSAIVTTHSPTTVAICPEDSIYEMNALSRTPEKIEQQKALDVLTEGVDEFRISTKNIRQIYTEGADPEIYQQLFFCLNRAKPFNYRAVFPQTGGRANRETVVNIVKLLNDAGNDLAKGVTDWDTVETRLIAPNVEILGGNRYSLENYILDPIYVALATRAPNSNRPFSNLDLNWEIGLSEIFAMKGKDLQALSDSVLQRCEIDPEHETECLLENGESVKLPNKFLKLKGHTWSHALVKHFGNELKRFTNSDPHYDKLMPLLMKTIRDFPAFLSVDIRYTFDKF
ncbi:ATP-binding protein [Sagittula sp. P11]|uniref:ATP-binding protein n=1 Tax=Sagittula sp. P11 TaxID=2009329 RepID=UPI0012FDB69F|nr:ATP-binding protein [Sagittula sp. P11]